YRALPGCKEVLTNIQDWERSGRDEEHRKALAGVVERASAERRDSVREVIKQLFPPAEWALGGTRYGHSFREEWLRELRACAPEVFDRYFHFAIREGDVSQAVIERLMSLSGDRNGLRQELRSLREQGLLESVVDRLEAYKAEIQLQDAVPFVTAIFDMGED